MVAEYVFFVCQYFYAKVFQGNDVAPLSTGESYDVQTW